VVIELVVEVVGTDLVHDQDFEVDHVETTVAVAAAAVVKVEVVDVFQVQDYQLVMVLLVAMIALDLRTDVEDKEIDGLVHCPALEVLDIVVDRVDNVTRLVVLV
jgi:hypothetical protein